MERKNFVKINYLKINKESIKFSKKTRIWCRLPYPNHPKGCPNFNKNPLCPPKAEYLENIINNYNFFYLVYASFDLRRHRNRMLLLHPKWSDRQANCLLYWQGSVKKSLKEYIKKIFLKNKEKKIYIFASGSGFKDKFFKQSKIYSMEAAGIDVFNILKNNHIDFELKPKNRILLVTLLCCNFELLFE